MAPSARRGLLGLRVNGFRYGDLALLGAVVSSRFLYTWLVSDSAPTSHSLSESLRDFPLHWL